MKQSIVHVALVVDDYDRAIEFYVGVLGFELLEDSWQPEQKKRWILVRPAHSDGVALLLARATTESQTACVGNQSGGRVFLFLRTDNFRRDYQKLIDHNVTIVREPAEHDYGTVAVFADLYGNLWDLIEYCADHPFAWNRAPG